ncbi:MAG: hypothetical protein M3Y03_02570 [Verrucomicrobiota bacterium]|nr:hypothetical protein [Verrucomicrobiota bacterium]
MRKNTARRTAWLVLALSGVALLSLASAQDEPKLVPEPVEVKTILPLLPEPPAGWKAEPAEGTTDDIGETKITTVHRDYTKGEGKDALTTSISILDSFANPEYVQMTVAGWTADTTEADGYSKAVTIEGLPGFETFANADKHGTLWLVAAKRYIVQIETTGQDATALQEWQKRIDLKKLDALK